MKKPRTRPLSDLIDECLGPALAAQGFSAADIVVGWEDIVGDTLAAHSEPIRIQWPHRPPGAAVDQRPEPATLHVRVEGAFALEFQYLIPVVIERVNTRYGWKCIGRVIIKQGPVSKSEPLKPLPEPGPEAVKAAQNAVGYIEDQGLKDALVKLGAGILARSSSRVQR